jgi:hypothetical protein
LWGVNLFFGWVVAGLNNKFAQANNSKTKSNKNHENFKVKFNKGIKKSLSPRFNIKITSKNM